MAKLTYHTISNRIPDSDGKVIQPSFNLTESKFSNLVSVLDDTRDNPIFNFSPSFFSSLNSISSLDLSMAVPYISLAVIDPITGDVVKDFNLEFFHKNIDFNTFKEHERFPFRPLISLKQIEVTTDLANGYIYFKNIKLDLKLHRLDSLDSDEGANALLAILVPGTPLLLKYGWSSKKNDFLNQKEELFFAVKDYTLSVDETGQADIGLNGMAFNDSFTNVFIGDVGEAAEGGLSPIQVGGISVIASKVLEVIKEIRNEKMSVNNDIRKFMASDGSIDEIEKKVSGSIKNNTKILFKKVPKKPGRFGKDRPGVTVHDLVYSLCNPAFNNMMGKVFPVADKYRFIYGDFNETLEPVRTEAKENNSIADFYIHWKRFIREVGNEVLDGNQTLTIGRLLNIITRSFLNSSTYFTTNKKDPEIKEPNVISFFNNRVVGGVKIFEIYLIDINRNLPVTTRELSNKKNEPASVLREKIKDKGIPIIKLGNAHSVIKKLTMSQIADQYMKSVFIERMYRNRVAQERDSETKSKSLKVTSDSPLTLPLGGSMEVLGSVEWKPFRAFYLDSGFWLTSAVYKLTKVSHRLSADGFSTTVDFVYH